ncbi:unnamed protein product [Peronospora belbahrii]|uniref:AAA+ ATPase domain-containing protein n=1 Tax=Peronospora belbahrii TaxID=622444 RepID=A0ABN8CTN3_9STRA|nr:unnamed protein product [Peronospora belbahrii]
MTSTECPICSRHVRLENLSLHVDTCLAKQDKSNALLQSPLSSSMNAQSSTSSSSSNHSPFRPSQRPTDVTPSQVGKKRKHSPRDNHSAVPLAERMRPKDINNLVGQDELVGPGRILTTLIEMDRVPNMIIWGPPGCGKTTLATIIAEQTKCKFITLSATTSKVSALKDTLTQAEKAYQLFHRRTIVFIDEIHHYNKTQQTFLLPAVENGTITLLGATTENPSFEITNALLSRCRVYTLKKHSLESMTFILQRALNDHVTGGIQSLTLKQKLALQVNDDPDSDKKKTSDVLIEAEDEAIEYLAKQCDGDARIALNCLEMALQTAPMDTEKRLLRVTAAHVHHCFAHRQTLFYDRNADMHYDCISALHKSVRGSDENATLYWLARMLEGGENPLYVARRLIRIASEDVGLAAPELLPMAVSAYQAAHFVGMPECDVVLAHVATMLARAPKSIEVYAAYKRAKLSIKEWDKGALPDVPLHLRNAPTKLMKQMGYGKEYKYNPHYSADELKDQTYLPDELAGTNFFKQNDVHRDAC